LQSHIWRTASSYMNKYLRISSYIRKSFLIYDFATAPIWISLFMRKFFFFISAPTLLFFHGHKENLLKTLFRRQKAKWKSSFIDHSSFWYIYIYIIYSR
jgi:hypothetical protein